MIATFKIDKPDTLEATMFMTMTVGEWRKLKKQLDDHGWPASDLGSAIFDLVQKAEKHFHYVTEE